MTATDTNSPNRLRMAVLATYDDANPPMRAALAVLFGSTLRPDGQRIWDHVTVEDVLWADGPAITDIDWDGIVAERGWSTTERLLIDLARSFAGVTISIALDDLGYLDRGNTELVTDAIYVLSGHDRTQSACRDRIGRAFAVRDQAVSA